MVNRVAAKVLIVGCGDLGGKVASQLAQLDYEVIGVRRRPHNMSDINTMHADVTKPESLAVLKNIQPEILIYCVAANGQTDEQYKAQYVDGLNNVLATQHDNAALMHVFFVSSTRVYGQIDSLTPDALLNESSEAIPTDFGGERLLEAENLLKRFNPNNSACGTTVLRLSGIYGPGRLRMINLAKSPENWPEHNSWSNRIHRDDAAAFMVFLVEKVMMDSRIAPLYIVTDSKPTSQYEVLHWIAAQLKTALPSTIPPIEGGKRLNNQAMLASGFKLQFPDFQSGYQSLLAEL